jgi:hypothetical protein
MPSIEIQIRLIPDPGEYTDPNYLLHAAELSCAEFGPGPWNEQNCTSLMLDLQTFIRSRIIEFRLPPYNPFSRVDLARSLSNHSPQEYPQTMEEILEVMTRNGITVDQEAVRRIRDESFGVLKEPDANPPPTRFERVDVI